MSPKPKAISLLSGGLDSTVTLAHAKETMDVVLALTMNYGQKAFGKEIRAARSICEAYGVRHQVVVLPWLSELLPEALRIRTGYMSEPGGLSAWRPNNGGHASDLFDAKPVWVPNRNGLFLNIAATYAEALEAEVILFGANAEEAERFPDNTLAFRDRVNAAFEYSTLSHPRVETPLGHLNKQEILSRAQELNVPLQNIWSCYSDTRTQCGLCPSCIRLKQALANSPAGARYREKIHFLTA